MLPRLEDPLVRIERVERCYAGFPDVHALQASSLQIFRGDFLTIVGPSGSGKSTLLNILGLLDRPTGGLYELNGIDVGSKNESDRAAIRGREIGFVFQSLNLLEQRTSVENVMLATAYQGLSYKQSAERVGEALASVGMAHRSGTVVSRLSGGERQRVAIARALAARPAMLLCDEPTGNLDSANSDDVMRVLSDLHDLGTTIVFITHNPVAASRGTRQVRIQDGILTEMIV